MCYSSRVMKPVTWMGSSKEDLKAFPEEARREVGYQLEHVQEGADPDDWKPMPAVGRGCTRPEGIYVLHCFQKKTQKTSRQDLDLAQRRFKSIQVNS